MIPPRHYVVIENPLVRNAQGEPVRDKNGNYLLLQSETEIRLAQEPFPLYPGEKIKGDITELTFVPQSSALRISAQREFVDASGVKRNPGDEWLFEGPCTYFPRIEERVVRLVSSIPIGLNQALRLRASRGCIDRDGHPRKDGEEWIVRNPGPYLPGVDEEPLLPLMAYEVLQFNQALHLAAERTFVDQLGRPRRAGEEWLVSHTDAATYIPDVQERLVTRVSLTTLNSRQYCVVRDPIGADGKLQMGRVELRRGPTNFFLHPGEVILSGIQDVHILSEDQALLLRAREAYVDENGESHSPGDRWMVRGPCDYVPPVQVEIVQTRAKIPLDQNEGIYVRDIPTGKVRAEIGESYMLKPNEELWEKTLPQTVEQLLTKLSVGNIFRPDGSRDPTRVVTLRAPYNSAVQLYDFKERKKRVVFGPDLVMLAPEEEFTVLSLSGGTPKVPHKIKALTLMLGPDFMTDIVTVETSDHARLQLKLSYNWNFEIDHSDLAAADRLFAVPDFVGDCCKAIAGRVRSVVAATPFDAFHKASATLIREAIFGRDANGSIQNRFTFPANSLSISNIDIQSVEPVDHRTRDSLMKSVQLAIEITTKSQEARARHESERKEQKAKGELQRQRIADDSVAESARAKLVELKSLCNQLEAQGTATAEAQARSNANSIIGEANVLHAKDTTEAGRIRTERELQDQEKVRSLEVNYKRGLTDLEIHRQQELAKIEASKFKNVVVAIGPETIAEISNAGPEMQAQLLSGLGLKSFLITDGTSPVNLFSTATGLLGTNTPASST